MNPEISASFLTAEDENTVTTMKFLNKFPPRSSLPSHQRAFTRFTLTRHGGSLRPLCIPKRGKKVDFAKL